MVNDDWVNDLKPSGMGGAESIAQERLRSQIPVSELSLHVLGSEFLERQERILNLLEHDKLFSKTTQANLSRPQRYQLGLARAKKLRRLADQYNWSDDDYETGKYLTDDVSPYALHTSMFRQTLREQTSDSQRDYWLARHKSWEIIGAYAQTEMSHGSNVRGIELQAKWDQATKEFILHSPTLTSSKWWPGSLGLTANHSIVVAQLLLPDSNEKDGYKSYGPHPFVVQIRDMETHKPFDGIVIGDIGPKYGYAPMDNGYMLFNNFRIPHSAMLSRYSRVSPETGKYEKPENPNVVYGSLTHARTSIVMHARLVLARAVTIAIRYTSMRRQFQEKDSNDKTGVEIRVLDYSTVQIRLLPLLSSVFALHYAGKKMKEVFASTREDVNKGDFSSLADLHALSSGLKSFCTDLAAGGIEISRRAMGGHGYGGYSGLVQLNADYLSKPTVEGDNWMITQQVSRYLIKTAKKVASDVARKPQNRTETNLARFWKTKSQNASFDIFRDDLAIVMAFERRAAAMTFHVYEEREVKHLSWNALLVEMHKLSQAHSRALLVHFFYEALLSELTQPTISTYTTTVLRDLFRLFAFTNIEADSYGFLSSETLSQQQLNSIPNQIIELMGRIRPHAVRLVDAWAVPDYLLDSSLGRYDGNVYEDMFNRAHRLNPLNKFTFNPDYHTEEIVHGSGDGGNILAKL